MRLNKQWHRPTLKRFIKPLYSISRAALVDSDCCMIMDNTQWQIEHQDIRGCQFGTWSQREVRRSTGHIKVTTRYSNYSYSIHIHNRDPNRDKILARSNRPENIGNLSAAVSVGTNYSFSCVWNAASIHKLHRKLSNVLCQFTTKVIKSDTTPRPKYQNGS